MTVMASPQKDVTSLMTTYARRLYEEQKERTSTLYISEMAQDEHGQTVLRMTGPDLRTLFNQGVNEACNRGLPLMLDCDNTKVILWPSIMNNSRRKGKLARLYATTEEIYNRKRALENGWHDTAQDNTVIGGVLDEDGARYMYAPGYQIP